MSAVRQLLRKSCSFGVAVSSVPHPSFATFHRPHVGDVFRLQTPTAMRGIMTFLSVAERVFCVRAYYESGRSLKAARRAFAVAYSTRRPPSAKTVWKVVRKFETHGSVCDRRAGYAGRPPAAVTLGNEHRAHATLLRPGTRRSIADAADQLGMSLSSAYRLSRRLCGEGGGTLALEDELVPSDSPEQRNTLGQQRCVGEQDELLGPTPSPCQGPMPVGPTGGTQHGPTELTEEGAGPECEDGEVVGPWEVVAMVQEGHAEVTSEGQGQWQGRGWEEREEEMVEGNGVGGGVW